MKSTEDTDWRSILRQRLALFGHRNWIVIADAAYPAQCSPGIETISADAGLIDVVWELMSALDTARHVRPLIRVDRELTFVSEKDAPGVDAFRGDLAAALERCKPDAIAHEEVLAKLDAAGQLYNVLIIKTDLTIPYTSVFVELDCGYWSADAEQRLRAAIP